MNNNANTYLVKLTPLGTFFFGGEQGTTADYYLKGNYFPQQTALLGLIRHQLLLQNNLLLDNSIKDKDTAKALIGESSFQYNNSTQTFGVIRSISECCIGNTVLNNNNEFCTCLYHPIPPVFTKIIASAADHWLFPEYDPKSYYPQEFGLLKTSKVCNPTFNNEEIFVESERPGIDKNYNGKPRNDAYYKQVWLAMKRGFCFAFYLTLDGTNFRNEPIFRDSIVTFGKESMPFIMEVTGGEKIPDTGVKPNQDKNALYLTSDAYVEQDLGHMAEIAAIDTVPFRNFINNVEQHRAAYFNRKPSEVLGSRRLQLYKRGSFFYAKDIKAIADKIADQKQFTKIGYNSFQFTTVNILT